MAVTTEHFYSGNNSTTSFAYTFPYYKTSDIKVKVGGTLKTESTHYNVTGTNIVFTSGNTPPTGTNNIHIYRDTDVDTSKATFAAGSSIRATDLNNNNLQLLYHAQEYDNTIQTGNIATAEGKGQLVNTNISATAAIAGTKIAPNFGSQNIATTGTLESGATTVTGNIAVTGTVDGRDVAADGIKLDSIESSATADQTNDEIKAAVAAASDSNVFTDAEKTKLAGISTAATPDQTAAEIRVLVEAATDSNVFTDADHTKLNAIEVSATADQTGAEIKSAYEGESNTNAYTDAEKTKLAGIAASANNYSISSDLLDEDNMATNSATKVPSQQSVKAYVDANAGGGGTAITIQDEGSALSTAASTINFVGAGVTASGTGTTKTITISGGGSSPITTDYQYLELKAHNNTSGAFSAGSADYELVTKGTSTAVSPDQAAAMLISIAGVLQEPNTGPSIGSNDGFCIDGSSIHFGANLAAHPDYIIWMKGSGSHTIDDDSIAEVKLDIHNEPSGTDKYLKYTSNGMEWATAGSGTPEGTAVLSTGESGTAKFLRIDGDGTCSWQVPPDTNTTYSVQDGQLSQNNFTDADHTKLNAIEASATADQTGAEIKTAYEAESDTNAYTDAEKTKLSGIEASATADQTDAEIRAAVEAASDSNVFTDADHTKLNAIAASANNYVHPNHSGEVTSTADGATVIEDNVVDEANLKVSNAPTNGYVLTAQSGNTGGMTWEQATAGATGGNSNANAVFWENQQTVTHDYTIQNNYNAGSFGPITINSGITVTVGAGESWTVI